MDDMYIKCLLIMEEVTKLREVIRGLELSEDNLVKIDSSLDEMRNILLMLEIF